MQGTNIAEKVGNWFEGWTNDSAIGKAIGLTATKFKDAFGLDKGPTFGDKYKNLAKDYTGRIGADTTNLPPSQRGLYANSAPSVESIQGAYQANLDNGMSHEAIMKSFNAQGASDAAWWKANPPPSSLLDKVKDAIPSTWASSAEAHGAATWTPDTTPLKSVDVSASGVGGQVSGGTDVFDVNKIGLLAAIDRIKELCIQKIEEDKNNGQS